MSPQVVPAAAADFYDFLAAQLQPILVAALNGAGPGQRIRVTTLPVPVMERLCRDLQSNAAWCVRLLSATARGEPWQATATKLIELRNTLELPLLVFIPHDLRTAAEDSLDIATFTELSLSTVSERLVETLLVALPKTLGQAVRAEVERLRQVKHVRSTDDEIYYLLTVFKNGATPEAAGAAIFLLGLIPDFELFSRGAPGQWVTRNQAVCGNLSDVAQPLQSRISRLRVKQGTIQQDLFRYLREKQADDVRGWGREIACDPTFRHLAFDKWEFIDGATSEELRLMLDPLSLPFQEEDKVAGAAQLKIFNLSGTDPLRVAFQSIPKPVQFPSWKSFRIQILAVSEGASSVAWESNNFPKPQGRNARITRSIKVNDLQALEEGTYFLRVEAFDADGALLNPSPRRLDPADPASRPENESERFLVVRDDVQVPPEDVRATYVPSLLDAWLRVSARDLGHKQREPLRARREVSGTWDEPLGVAPRANVHFELETPGFAGYSVAVPSLLRKAELSILEHPEHLGVTQIHLQKARSPADVEIQREGPAASPPAFEAFARARKTLFHSLLRHHLAENASADEFSRRAGLVETVDLAFHQEAVRTYAASYCSLAKDILSSPVAAQEGLRLLHSLDTIELRWRASPGDPGRAMLIAPTHPVRLMWYLRHTLLCEEAAQRWEAKSHAVPSWRDFFDQLRDGLAPANTPMVVFDRKGRPYVEHTAITRFWPLYLPDRLEGETQLDGAAARDRVIAALGVRDRTVVVSAVNAADVARRLFDYMEQHPYAEQLKINVFNPGDGRFVADVLRGVERLRLALDSKRPPPLRYSVNLFATSEYLDLVAEGLEGLLDPDRQVGEDDEFTLASSNHLLPKLVFARNTTEEFIQAPENFTSHVSILLEHFIAQGRVGKVEHLRRGTFVAGLVQEPDVEVVSSGGAVVGWTKGLKVLPSLAADATERGLCETLATLQRIEASTAVGKVSDQSLAPVVALQLDAANQALLRRVHDVSDWVLTVDRHLGLDYFDSPSSAKDVGYLLDFAPEYLQDDRQRILLTTRSTIELKSLIRPALERAGLKLQGAEEVVVLEALRSLSGRLALRFEASRTQSSEVVGLLLGRWLLDKAGLLQDRIVIPLDAHRGWFDQSGDEVELSRKRADLLLVAFEGTKTLRMDIVEVKLRNELSASGRALLYKGMHVQTENTKKRLRDLFDPELYPQPRADSLLRAKELGGALSFYVRRGVRYGLLDERHARHATQVIDALDQGYHIAFRSLGVVFEKKGKGTHEDEDEPGFRVYRFGSDVAQKLLGYAMGRQDQLSTYLSQRQSGKESMPPPAVPEDASLESLRQSLIVRAGQHGPVRAAEPAAPPVPSVPHNGPQEQQPRVPVVDQPVRPQDPPRSEQSPPHESTPKSGNPSNPAVLVGSTTFTPQFGILGKVGESTVGLDLNGCNTISLFGVQGFGKSYTLGVIAEMATTEVKGIGALPSPLATILFHYHKSDAYEPEHAAAVAPNRKQSEVDRLLREYSATPQGLKDVVLLTPEAKVEARRRDYPDLKVEPIKFRAAELGAESWKFLLGAYGNDSLYMRQLVAIMRRHRDALTLDTFRQEIEAAELSKGARQLAEDRLRLAEPYLDDTRSLGSLLRPGRTIIVDLRDEWIEKDEALGLFVVMLRIFAAQKYQGREFNKLVVFDEAHKYITESELIGQVVETIREMRHQATSVVIASQDPLSVPRAVVELTSILVLHRITSPQWLKHLKGAIGALEDLSESQVSSLRPGEALLWAQRSTDPRFTQRPQRIVIRPRFTQHGGGTKTAVEGLTTR